MRILQLSSDWKWTGPAEPMLLLLRALRERGHEVELACPEAPGSAERSLAGEARAAGLAPVLSLDRGRGVRPWRDHRDLRALRELIDERDFQRIHTWHTRDHVLALRAASARRAGGRTRIVRSQMQSGPIGRAPWNRWLFGPGSDGLICASRALAEANRPLRGGRPVLGVLGAVDLERFTGDADPRAAAGVREELGLEPRHRLIGVVARVQRHRRYDLIFAALAMLADSHPDLRLLVLGRGTHFDEVARRPVAELGLEDRVLFAGYRRHDYPGLLRELDLLTFLVPGSDGSCRAVLEASASGVPTVATRRGALPEIVVDGESGCFVDERAEALAEAWSALLEDPESCRKMGERARSLALERFDPRRLASEVEGLYEVC